MKTGTITFHFSNNNGSFLQAYALQKALTDNLNVDNEIINLCSRETENLYKIIRPIKKVSDIFRTLVSVLHYKELKKRSRCFDEMRESHLLLSKRFTEEKDALLAADEYDCVIAGSDQIWNITAHDFVKAFFLPAINTKKVTYAVSCGSNVDSMSLDPFSEYINEFSHLSTREIKSADVISKIYQTNDISTVIDPTLLLTQDQYEDLYKKDERTIKTPYIFLYSINYNKEVLKTAKRISKIYKMPVVTVFTSYHAIMCRAYGIKVMYDAGPSEFLNLIKNAEYVLTNSFHGTAFSIIFEKNFYHLCSSQNGKVLRDDRINGLLDKLNLEQNVCLFSTEQEILDKSKIDYMPVRDKVERLKEEAFNYLKKALF